MRDLVDAGMDVARLNFSHGNHADHERVLHLRPGGRRGRRPAVGILADLQGPKIRLGRFADGPVEWRTGDTVVITSDDVAGHRRPGVLHLRASCPQEVQPATGC